MADSSNRGPVSGVHVLDRLTPPPHAVLRDAAARALAEDLGGLGDVTSAVTIPASARLRAAFVARQPGRIAGMDLVRETFAQLDPAIQVTLHVADGMDAAAGAVLAVVDGPARAVLTGERTALNFLSHLSGIATLTARYVAAIAGAKARVAGTRKTTPGLRALEHYAIRAGGGAQHRGALFDAVLIKDNHIAAAGGVAAALIAARTHAGHMVRVSVEVDDLDQLDIALRHGPDVVLLDNFSVADLRTAVTRIGGRCVAEASGGVNVDTVAAIAATGVDVISVGALTHSAPVLDIGLDAWDG